MTTFGLGVWQIKRKIWKEQLIAELKHQINKKPVDLPEEYVKMRNNVKFKTLLCQKIKIF